MTQTSCRMLTTLCLLAAIPPLNSTSHAAEEAAPLILDTSSFWRCHLTLRDPVYGTAAEAKPGAPGREGRRYDTDLPPAGWAETDFDDSDWSRSPGPFFGGYGRGEPEMLALLCLRAGFAVADPGKAGDLTLACAFRGGARVFLNGKEVARAHLPEGEIGLEALANDYPWEAYVRPDGAILAKGDPATHRDRFGLRVRKIEGIRIPAAALRKGRNVVAIEIHRAAIHPNAPKLAEWYREQWSTVGLLSARVTAASAEGVAANTARPGGFQVWNAVPLTPVFDMDYGDPGAPVHPIRIVGTRGGSFSGQIVVGCDKPIRGLRAEVSPLRAGGAAFPADACRVRYALPGGGAGGAGERYPGVRDVTAFDTLAETPPEEVRVQTKEMSRHPGSVNPVFGAIAPIWVTVAVPADAAPGSYEGTLTLSADGMEAVAVPVQVNVCAWKLPDTFAYRTHTDFVQSPESVALRYNVPLWSDEHFKLLERSLRIIGAIGNKTCYIHLMCRTNHGNSETLVRWVKQADGAYKHDFSVMERYLDLYLKCTGKPDFVIFYVWEKWTGGGYFGRVRKDRVPQGPPVTAYDPKTGKTSEIAGPPYETPESKTFWQPVVEGIRKRLKERGLADRMVIGIASDSKPSQDVVEFWKSVAPEARWSQQGHGDDGAYYGVPVAYNTTVWKAAWAPDPSVRRYYGWAEKRRLAHFHRDLWRMEAIAQLLTSRLLAERNIQGKQHGFGRMNADFWPVLKDKSGNPTGSISARFPESTWNQCNIRMTPYLAPGPSGALSTVRFEMMREGVQECEARIFIESALLDAATRAKLGEERAKRLEEMLNARTRRINSSEGQMGALWYAGSPWRKWSEELYTTAAEVEGALGRN